MKFSTLRSIAISLSLSSALITSHAWADEVDEGDITNFEDGSPALADEVNSNFQALITAINDNASRINSLEGSSSVSGKTFRLNQIGILLRGDGNGAATSANLSQTYLVSFNEDMSFSFIGEENEGELNTVTGEFGVVNQAEPVNISGTYSQSNSSINLDLGDGESVSFTVSLDGNVMLLSEFAFGGDNAFQRSESSFLVGIAIE